MVLDLRKFFQATNPSRTLAVENEEDQKYYIDFSSVRGGQIIEELRDNIAFFSPDDPTCQLFTGHIGCGKSTELRRLEMELNEAGFHVIYFESSQDLEMGDLDVGDILLAIASRVSQSLENIKEIEKPPAKGFKNLLQGAAKLLQTEIELSGEANVLGVGKVSGNSEGKFSAEIGLPGIGQVNISEDEGLSFVALGIGKITAKAKNSPELRSKLQEYLAPRTANLLEIINNELLQPSIESLKKQGKNGLVVIVDNLDRVENIPKAWGRPQQEYLFVDRGDQLSALHCHVVYTMPISLMFSNDFNRLTTRFGVDPAVLPMVPVDESSQGKEGMALLRQMVLARAFPNESPEKRLELIPTIFDHPDTLDRLCRVSGGHVRELLRLLNDWIKKQRQLPLTREGLEKVIVSRRNQMTLAIDDQEWELLRQVSDNKRVSGNEHYQVLIRSMFVYEYRNEEGSWFGINPLLMEAEQFKK